MVYHCSVPAQTQMWDLVEHPIKRVNACGLCCAPVWSLVILLYCDSNLFPMQTINNTRQSGCAHVMWKFNDQMIKVHAMYIYLCFPISIAIEIEVIVAFASCCPSFFLPCLLPNSYCHSQYMLKMPKELLCHAFPSEY